MVRAGIAGLGRWGQVLVSSVQGKSEKIRFTAGCTGRRERAQAFCDEHGIALGNNLDDLLQDPEIDAIILATPHSLHPEQIIAIAAGGKPVFVEKSFALERRGAEAAVTACRDAGVICAPGHNRRFLPALMRLRDIVAGGALGTIMHVEANFSSGSALRFTPEHWRASPTESPAGGMTGLGIHIVDALISCLGPISDVTTSSERRAATIDPDVIVDDTTFITLRFANGCSGYFGTIYATARDWRIQIFGDKGWAEMRGYNRLTIKMLEDSDEQVIDFESVDIERAELEAFAQAIGGGDAYPVPLDETIHGIAVFEAIVSSAKTGKTESVD